MTKTVLILDDEPNFRKLLKSLLEVMKLNVLEASDAEQAIETMANNEVELVLVDLGLPKFSGLEFLEAMHMELPTIPCVVISGQPAELMLQSCKNVGAIDYLEKPFDLPELKTVICKVLDLTADNPISNLG